MTMMKRLSTIQRCSLRVVTLYRITESADKLCLTLQSRVHNSREGECLTAFTCFKRTALRTESIPLRVN